MSSFWQDLRYGARQLARSPGFTAVAVLTLALGIGATTAIFSVLSAILLRPLPYGEPDRIVSVWEKRPRENVFDNVVSPADFLDWRERNRVFESMAAQILVPLDLTGAGEPESLFASQVSAPFFEVFGMQPALGRFFLPEEERPGKNQVVVLSHGLWARRFGGRPDAIGRTLHLNDSPYTVIGVLPESFPFPAPAQLWIPYTFPPNFSQVRGRHFLRVFARLKPGVTLQLAQAQMDEIGAALEREHPDDNRGHGVNVMSLREHYAGDVRKPLLVLFGAVGFVALIACANVANLLLVRGASRQREFAVRLALGGSRGRIVRLLLVESVLLAALAGAAGSLLALWATDALKAIVPADLFVNGTDTFKLDFRVLIFLAGISLLTAVLFGLAPALHSSRLNLVDSLKEGGLRTGAARSRKRLHSTMVVAEFALSLVLLVGAGLMVRTLLVLHDVDPGFRPEKVWALGLTLPTSRYPEHAEREAFYRELLERLTARPGVLSAGTTSHLPLTGQDSRTYIGIEGREPNPDEPTRAHHRVVSPGYFETLRIPVLAGRSIQDTDRRDAPPVVIINRAAAERFWPGESPLGRRFLLGGTEEWREVVGVVADVKHWGLDAPANPEMYLPRQQYDWRWTSLLVRSDLEPAALAATLRREIRSLEKDLPVGDLRPMDAIISHSLAPRRFYLSLLAAFAGLAATLAAVGIYGVLSYSVADRSHEMGVRMAVGALPRDIFRLVLRQGMALAAIGLLLGGAGALALTRVISSQLFGVPPDDPVTFAAVSLLLVGVSLLACWIPARRAARVDLMTALRYE